VRRAFKAIMGSPASTAAASAVVAALMASEAEAADSTAAAVEGDRGRICDSLVHC